MIDFDRPLGIADLGVPSTLMNMPLAAGDHWYWCRRHERAEHVNQPVHSWYDEAEQRHKSCIRIGPFMSEREANILAGDRSEVNRRTIEPLGMEVEG